MEINIEDIDFEKLRCALEDYYGTAMFNVSPFAMVDLIELDKKDDYAILNMAINLNFDLSEYLKGKRY